MSFFNPREPDIKKAAEKWCDAKAVKMVSARDLVIELTRTTSWKVKESVVLFHLKALYRCDGDNFIVRK